MAQEWMREIIPAAARNVCHTSMTKISEQVDAVDTWRMLAAFFGENAPLHYVTFYLSVLISNAAIALRALVVNHGSEANKIADTCFDL